MKKMPVFIKIISLLLMMGSLLGLLMPDSVYAQDTLPPVPTEIPIEPTPQGWELLPSEPDLAPDENDGYSEPMESQQFSTFAASPSEVRGYWEFENNLVDSSIYGNYGSDNPVNSARYEGGNCGTGLSRNGAELPIRLQNRNLSLFPGKTATLEGWVYSSNFNNGFRHIIDNFNGYALSIVNGQPGIMLHGPSSWWIPVNSPQLTLNQWHYIVATYDGTYERLYVDGVYINGRYRSIQPIPSGTGRISIGGVGTGENAYLFQGTLDSVRVTSRALTADEILANYAAGQCQAQVFSINKVAVIDNGGNPLPWDALVVDTLTVEAQGIGSNSPNTITVKVSALKSGKVTSLTLNKVSTLPDETHIYRGSRAASDLVNRTSELTVAAVVYEQVDVDYQVAEKFMNDLGVPDARRMGIAWGNGDQSQNRPPANLDYFHAAGYEPAQVEVVGYPGVMPGKFFIQNQASVLVYIGHGWHDTNHLCVAPGTPSRDCTRVYPLEIGNSWADGLKTVVQLGCSVLDINDMNGWWGNLTSPGKKWVALTGPQTWLGFQAKAPVVGDPKDHGENALYFLASEHAAGKGWVESWRKATSGEIASPKFVGAVSNESCTYHYWKEWKDSCWPVIGCLKYTWEATNSCADWVASSQGLEGFMASPAEMHIYDPQGHHVGPNAQGGIDTEIPDSAYWTPIVAGEPEADDRRVSIQSADLSQGYRLKLVGTGEGTFTFNLEIPDRISGKLYQVLYASVPVSRGAVFTLTLARGTDFALAADANGDGVFEGQVIPSDISTRALDLPVSLTLNGTTGENGWYTSDVTVKLSASTRTDLPSITSLEYDLGNGWQPYQAPLTISQENVTALNYRGTFSNGNLDAIQRVNVQVDKTPPVITLVQPSVTSLALCSTFSVEYEAQDVTSGLDTVTATFDGEAITSGQTFDAIFLAPGSHEIVVTARDKAGLITTKTYTIKVEASIEDLICAKHRLYDMGQIYGPGAQGIVKSLDAKLEAAQRAQARGQNPVAVNKLNAFIQEVEAQTGKHITSQAAAILIRAAQYVITNLTR
jgi:hypothetical protein